MFSISTLHLIPLELTSSSTTARTAAQTHSAELTNSTRSRRTIPFRAHRRHRSEYTCATWCESTEYAEQPGAAVCGGEQGGGGELGLRVRVRLW
jgi:hypothetical protein